jgi:putative hydrolase of the HAD superfamily
LIHAICFDFDGTLAHFTGDFLSDVSQGAAELGIPGFQHEDFTQTYLQFDKVHSTFYEAVQATLSTFNKPLPEDFEGYCERRIKKYVSQLELLAGARELLEHLTARSIPLAIITNGPKDMQAAAIQHVNIQGCFKTILISGEVEVRKPNARIFLLACEHLQVQPEHCLMVGDNLDADVKGAKAVGMQTAWLSSEKLEDILSFGDLGELETWLQTKL